MIVERQEVVQRGLNAMLAEIPTVTSVHACVSIKEVAERIRTVDVPDVVLISSHAILSEGSAGSTIGCEAARPPRRIVLVASHDAAHLRVVTRTAADGFLMLRELTMPALGEALRHVRSTTLPLPTVLADYLLARARGADRAWFDFDANLSPREKDVLALVVDGLSNKQIANQLGISIHGAKRHVSSILTKLDSPSRTHLVSVVLTTGGIGPSPSFAAHGR